VRRLLLFSLCIFCACGGSAQQTAKKQLDDFSKSLDQAKTTNASHCAPQSLAMADSQLTFAKTAFNEDARAETAAYLHLAQEALNQAKLLSSPDICVDKLEDSDSDGVPDEYDQCPSDKEDVDGYQDADGCPDLDNDSDGVLDAADKCPFTRGYPINHGCAVTDRDGDGIPDKQDVCADISEDKDGVEDQDGCPEDGNGDTDGDKIVDRLDACPTIAEDIDNFEDEDGCSDPDNDLDGIPDEVDKCLNEFGTQENNGCNVGDKDNDKIADNKDKCPDLPGPAPRGCPAKVYVTKTPAALVLKTPIVFTKEGVSKGAPTAALDQIAAILRANPTLKIVIEAQAMSSKLEDDNEKLSRVQGTLVKTALVEKGIEASRLEVKALGSNKGAKLPSKAAIAIKIAK
jgi:OmpA-OmpF porin, OOP family